jgi:endonuclease-3
MQAQFGFCGHDDLTRWRGALAPLLPDTPHARRSPIGQLVKSMLGGRTRDAVTLAAYGRLVAAFGSPKRVARASPDEVAALVGDVTFAEEKAAHVVETLRRIGSERPDYRLDFLGAMPVPWALNWLERFPGVGRKVAASTLNASTLDRPVLIVDSHVLRVLQRLGFVAPHAEPRAASEAVTAAMPDWRGGDFLDFHIVTKRLGQLVCHHDAPDCAACPLAAECPSRLTG